jgi:nucleotide-binding universal stress UspA family protein
MKPIRRVLCATDFSAASRRALDTATALAKSTSATLTILHVLAPLIVVPEHYLDAAAMQQLDARARAWGIRELQKLSKRAHRAGVETTVLVRSGDPAEQIVGTIRALKADLAVTGTHGRRGVKKLFLGSVAQRVVALASCPVVTVRGS